MFRSIPVSNKICFDKQLKRNWRIHEQKISSMKSKLSKERSEEFTFLDQSKKRNVLKDIKNREVERSNHILFRKIQEIERKGCKNSYIKMDKQKNVITQRLLHEPYRKKQLIRIVEENQDLMKRIKEKKSAYNVRQMELERKQVEKNISLMTEFKYKNYPATSTKCNFYMEDDKNGQGSSRITNRDTSSTGGFQSEPTEPRCKTTAKNRMRSQNGRFVQATRQINSNHYVITTYTNKGTFYIEVENLENHLDKYRMDMTEKQLQKLLEQFYDNKMELLIENLDIDVQSQNCYLKYQKKEGFAGDDSPKGSRLRASEILSSKTGERESGL